MTIGRVAGYHHPAYARSFLDHGNPVELPHSGSWIVERQIPGSDLWDAMGCYPLFTSHRWARLALDLPALAPRLVTLVLVTDPFSEVTAPERRRMFDVVWPFKEHYTIDLARFDARAMPRTHRRNVARALRSVQVEACPAPRGLLDEWIELYDQLIARHDIVGMRAFSREAFAHQLSVPGLAAFRATREGAVVGLHLWYVQDDVAYAHLGATSARGYDVMASYALYWHAMAWLRGRVRWVDLGSSPGEPDNPASAGLRRFKAGWANATRQTYLCGRIFQPEAYAHLVAERGATGLGYFPAYRCGEFTSQAPPVPRAHGSGG
ncbi:MAG TPA: GNAT family N-acetyltransferase [Vicinamibacterales bacterium]|nr:GNAT family N-acetyltransferase [Vicinamibacterales bacterium]